MRFRFAFLATNGNKIYVDDKSRYGSQHQLMRLNKLCPENCSICTAMRKDIVAEEWHNRRVNRTTEDKALIQR